MASEDLKQAALAAASAPAALPSDPFAVSYLQLCQVSYLPASSIPTVIKQVPPLDPGGSWKCVWGPAQDWDDSNLVFVAAYYSGGIPVFASAVIRGTDIDIDDPLGVVEQIWEDMDATSQGQLPWLDNGNVLVARGTLDALSVIQNLTSGGQTADQFLASFLQNPANQKPVLIVTGHSLGGCLTTVVAPWLQFQLKQTGGYTPIVPATFAGPSAGNTAFAQYYDSCFSYAMRYVNSLDIAPLAWGNLADMDTIYDSCGLPIPDAALAALVGMGVLFWETGASYAQPFTNKAPMTGNCYGAASWYDEAYYQHHTTTYMALMGGASIISEVWRPRFALGRPRVSRPSRLIARSGGIRSTLARLP
jgi:triacylglycerol lipase